MSPATLITLAGSKPQVLVKTSDAAQLTQLVTSEGAQVRRRMDEDPFGSLDRLVPWVEPVTGLAIR